MDFGKQKLELACAEVLAGAPQVDPSYSRSGFHVYLVSSGFYVPGGAGIEDRLFPTLAEAWAHCESLYFSWI